MAGWTRVGWRGWGTLFRSRSKPVSRQKGKGDHPVQGEALRNPHRLLRNAPLVLVHCVPEGPTPGAKRTNVGEGREGERDHCT